MREIKNFNKGWTFFKGNYTDKVSLFKKKKVNLPHTYNAKDGQDGGNDYYRGLATYSKTFSYYKEKDKSVFLEFKGAGQRAEVYLNDHHLVTHLGGYSTFRVEITDYLKDKNKLVVVTDNSFNKLVYPQKADFTFYGGIYRDVNLIITPKEHFELIKDGSKGIKVTSTYNKDKKSATIEVESWQNADKVTYKIEENTKTVKSIDGYAKATFTIRNPHLWNGLADPYLYEVYAILPSEDLISTKFGIRSFKIDPNEGFILNGVSYPLRGVARHADRPNKGYAISTRDHEEDINLILDMGANFVRLAHYQHDDYFYDLCDEKGLLVWAEIPYISKHMDEGKENTLSQMRELITQCYNHPSIITWCLSNEITVDGKITQEMIKNHQELNDLCHQLDETRPTTMANVFMLEIDSPMIGISDVCAYNLYYGWYVGSLQQNEEFLDEFHQKHPEIPLGLSEYGADANTSIHNSKPDAGDYSEEYQCVYHEHLLNCIENRKYLWMSSAWNMFDFAADGRDEGGKKGINQKGLVTFDRKTKKDAFYAYKAYWSKDPFVHICSKRYVNHMDNEVLIKVYSNQNEVSLYANGKLVETKKGNKIFEFKINNNKTTKLMAKSGDLIDNSVIKQVKKEDKSYSLGGGAVTNWFDNPINPEYYSIDDKIGDLLANPECAKIFNAIMAKAQASRGDVAKESSSNKMLMKMISGLKLSSLVKKAGKSITPEMIKDINNQFQKIKK